MSLFKLGLFMFALTISITQCVSNVFAAPPKRPTASKTLETRKASERVSKSLLAKLKAQALAEARAELARENETRERARLEALQELDAGASVETVEAQGGADE